MNSSFYFKSRFFFSPVSVSTNFVGAADSIHQEQIIQIPVCNPFTRTFYFHRKKGEQNTVVEKKFVCLVLNAFDTTVAATCTMSVSPGSMVDQPF